MLHDMDRERMELQNLKTPKQIAELCPALTLAAVYKLLFRSGTNGMDACIVRIGRKVLIDQAAFLVWLEGHRADPCKRR
jgi:hypothetical protein